MTDGFIFDYGGTLDTNGCHWGKVLWHAYEHCDAGVSEEMFRSAYVYAERTLAANRIILPGDTFHATLKKKIALQMEWLTANDSDKPDINRAEDILSHVYSNVCQTTKESVAVLKCIAKNHPMVLVSNFYGNIGTVIHEFGFDNLFQDIIESAVVGIRKPNPDIFKLGVERLGMEAKDVTVVGDSYDKDIVPAHAAGCKTVWMRGEGWTDDTVTEPVADIVIHQLSELL